MYHYKNNNATGLSYYFQWARQYQKCWMIRFCYYSISNVNDGLRLMHWKVAHGINENKPNHIQVQSLFLDWKFWIKSAIYMQVNMALNLYQFIISLFISRTNVCVTLIKYLLAYQHMQIQYYNISCFLQYWRASNTLIWIQLRIHYRDNFIALHNHKDAFFVYIIVKFKVS
jgi:hypothetical protein